MKVFRFLIVVISVLVGCQPESLDIDIPPAEVKMVLYTQALPDQALIISLSKSFSALTLPDDGSVDSSKTDSVNAIFINQFLVTNARISIVGPDYNDTLINLGTGFYIAPFFPFNPGNIYTITAYDSLTGFLISATTTTLPIASFEYFNANRKDGKDSNTIMLDYKINDLQGENYYLVNVYTDSIPQRDFFGFDNNSEVQSFVFSDREYAANELIRTDNFTNFRKTDTLVATLTNISRNYYDFLVAKNRAGNSFLSEPVSFPSNVNGGYGYFNLHFPSAKIITVK